MVNDIKYLNSIVKISNWKTVYYMANNDISNASALLAIQLRCLMKN